MHGALGHDEPGGDGAVAETLGHEGENLAFPRTEVGEGPRGPFLHQQLGDHVRIDDGLPPGHPIERVEELLDPPHPLLQQIADAPGTGREQVGREAEEEARESKRAMVADLSHDIATPVATIGAAAEVLELGESDPSRRERLATIRAKAAQVGSLVDDLVQANADDLARLPVDIDEISTRELESALSQAGAGLVRLPDALVLVDLRRWRQVVDNVLANADKYAGTPVEVAGALRGEVLEVTMRDRGPGVPDAELDAVLGRGVRGSTAGDTPGRGLGLHIADRLMARMGGAVELRPANPGLAVVLTLPLAGGQLMDR